jgi:hypothetical protein
MFGILIRKISGNPGRINSFDIGGMEDLENIINIYIYGMEDLENIINIYIFINILCFNLIYFFIGKQNK